MASFVSGAWCEDVVITPESNVFCQLEILVMNCQSSFSISDPVVSESVCLPPIYRLHMTPGAAGCALSHRAIWEWLASAGAEGGLQWADIIDNQLKLNQLIFGDSVHNDIFVRFRCSLFIA